MTAALQPISLVAQLLAADATIAQLEAERAQLLAELAVLRLAVAQIASGLPYLDEREIAQA